MKQRKLIRICYILLLLPYIIHGDDITESELDDEADDETLINDDEKIPESEHEFPNDNLRTGPDYRGPGHWATPAPETGIKLGFVPIKMYAQVRRSNTVKHLPRSDALASATSPEEIANAPRLREVVSSKKIQEVYTEEGYEDSAYDHGGFEKEASDGEGYEHREDLKKKPRRQYHRDSESQGSQLHKLKIGKDGDTVHQHGDSSRLPKIKQSMFRKEKHSMSVEKKGEDGVPKIITAEYSYNVRPSVSPSSNLATRLQQVSHQKLLPNPSQPIIFKGLSEKSYKISANMKVKPTDFPVKIPAPFLVPPSADPPLYRDISVLTMQNRLPHYTTDSPIEGLVHRNIISVNPTTFYPSILPYQSGFILVHQNVPNRHLNIFTTAPSTEQIVINNVPYILDNNVLRGHTKSANINVDNVRNVNNNSKNFTRNLQNHDNNFSQNNITSLKIAEHDTISQQDSEKDEITGPQGKKNSTQAQYVSDLTMSHYGSVPHRTLEAINRSEGEIEKIVPRVNKETQTANTSLRKKYSNRNFSGSYLPFSLWKEPNNWPFDKIQRRNDEDFSFLDNNFQSKGHTSSTPNLLSISGKSHVPPEIISNEQEHYSGRKNVFSNNVSDINHTELINYDDTVSNAKTSNDGKASIYSEKENITRSDNYVEESGIGNPKYLSAEEEERKLVAFEEEIDKKKDEELREKEREWEEALKHADEGITKAQHIDKKKYPFYTDSASNIAPLYSAIRYATNPDLVPEKTEGGMEFYESRENIHCPEVSPKLDVVPKRKAPGEWNKKPKPPLPRLYGLGDKIDCLRAKYFGVDPLDNPFFRDSDAEGSENKRSIETDDTELFYGEIMENIRAVQHASNFPVLNSAIYKRNPYAEYTASSNQNVNIVTANGATTGYEDYKNSLTASENREYHEDENSTIPITNYASSIDEVQNKDFTESQSNIANSKQNAQEKRGKSNNIQDDKKQIVYNEDQLYEKEHGGFFSASLFKEDFNRIPSLFSSLEEPHLFDVEYDNLVKKEKEHNLKINNKEEITNNMPCTSDKFHSQTPACVQKQNHSDSDKSHFAPEYDTFAYNDKSTLPDDTNKIITNSRKVVQSENEEHALHENTKFNTQLESSGSKATRVVDDMLSEETSVYYAVVNIDGSPPSNFFLESEDQAATNSDRRERRIRKSFTKERFQGNEGRNTLNDKHNENKDTKNGDKTINIKIADKHENSRSKKAIHSTNEPQRSLKNGRRMVKAKDAKSLPADMRYRNPRQYPYLKMSNTNNTGLQESKKDFLQGSNFNYIQDNNATTGSNVDDDLKTEIRSRTLKGSKNSKEDINKGFLTRGTPFIKADIRRGEPRYENIDFDISSTSNHDLRRTSRDYVASREKTVTKTHLDKFPRKHKEGKQKKRLIDREDYDYISAFHPPEDFIDYDYEITQDGSQLFEQRQQLAGNSTVRNQTKDLNGDREGKEIPTVEHGDDSLTAEEINRILGGFISRHKPTFSSRYSSKGNITTARPSSVKNVSSVETTSNPEIIKTVNSESDNGIAYNATDPTENNVVSGRRQRKSKRIYTKDVNENSTEKTNTTYIKRRRPTDKAFSRQIETTTQLQEVQTVPRKRHRIRLTTRKSTISTPTTVISTTTAKSTTAETPNKNTTPFTIKKKPVTEKNEKDSKNLQTAASKTTKGRLNKIATRDEELPGKSSIASTHKLRGKPKENSVQTPFLKNVRNSANSNSRFSDYKGKDSAFIGSFDYSEPSHKSEHKVSTTASSPRNVAVEHRRVTKEEFFTRTYIPEDGLAEELIQESEIDADSNSRERDDRSKKSTKKTDIIEDIYEPYETLQYKRKQLPESTHHYAFEPLNNDWIDRSDNSDGYKETNEEGNKNLEKDKGFSPRMHKQAHINKKSGYVSNEKSIDHINDEELLYIRKPRRKSDAVRTDSTKSERDTLFVERALESLSRQTLANKSPDGTQDDVSDTGERTLSYIVDTETGIGKWIPSRDANRKKGNKKLSTSERVADVATTENEENEKFTDMNTNVAQTKKKENRTKKRPRSKKGNKSPSQQYYTQDTDEIAPLLEETDTENPQHIYFLKNARKKITKKKQDKILETEMHDDVQALPDKVKLKPNPGKADFKTSVGYNKNVMIDTSEKKTNYKVNNMMDESRNQPDDISLISEDITEVNVYQNPVTTASIKRGKIRRISQAKKVSVNVPTPEDRQITETDKISNEDVPKESDVFILSKILHDVPPARRLHIRSNSSSTQKEERKPENSKPREIRQNGKKVVIKNPEDRLYFYVQYQPN